MGNRKSARFFFSVLTLIGLGVGVVAALRSDLFLVRLAEVEGLTDRSPVSAAEIIRQAEIPIGKISIFDLNFAALQSRIERHPWVHSVRLQKKLPGTVVIRPELRIPRAVLQSQKGKLYYVDESGHAFAPVNARAAWDLPLITALVSGDSKLPAFIELVQSWEKNAALARFKLLELRWDIEKGVRALATYPLGPPEKNLSTRVWVELGLAAEWQAQLPQLAQVFEALSARAIAARQIWADIGKKIVVKTAHGS